MIEDYFAQVEKTLQSFPNIRLRSWSVRIHGVTNKLLERIRNAILYGEYDLTHHAIEEMADDDLGIFDVENAVLSGEITKIETDDPRGPRHTVIGWSEDWDIEVGIAGRFTETGTYLIITVYEVTQLEGE